MQKILTMTEAGKRPLTNPEDARTAFVESFSNLVYQIFIVVASGNFNIEFPYLFPHLTITYINRYNYFNCGITANYRYCTCLYQGDKINVQPGARVAGTYVFFAEHHGK